MFLVVTNESDVTSDYIILELRDRGHPFFRLNTERLSRGQFSSRYTDGTKVALLRLRDTIVDLAQVRCGYFRRPAAPLVPEYVVGPAEREYCAAEWQALLRSLYGMVGDRWLNRPSAIANAEDKPLQISHAQRIGFRVPSTLISNDPSAITEFVEQGPTIAKTLRASLIGEGASERVIFTNRIASTSGTDPRAFEAAPAIYQREIDKAFDVRVSVVGSRCFTALIASQEFVETEVDWRRGSDPRVKHIAHELPKDVERQCVAITHHFDLSFSAIDLVLDRNGQYWFLEMNPNGQWAWIENRLGLPIARALVDEMERKANR